MKASEEIKAMISGWEGLRLKAYRCAAGVWTIGYGHTGADVAAGMVITEQQADALLECDLARVAEQLERLLGGVVVTQNQFDALLSLAFNIGAGALGRSTLLRKLRVDAADPAIAGEFRRWVYAGGRRQPGLEHRRAVEAALYFS